MEIIEKLEELDICQDQFIWFDCESFDQSSNYIDLFQELIKISNLNICNIVWREGWSQEKEHYLAEVTFEYKSQIYIIKVLCEEWFDSDLINELNSILEKDLLDEERFYFVKTDDQSLIVTFLNCQKSSMLQQNNLLADISEYALEKNDNWNSLILLE